MSILPEKSDLLVARALDGDRSAFGELIADPAVLLPARFATTIPALALEGKRLGLEIPEAWYRRLIGTAVSGMHLKARLDDVGKTLDSADIPWMPIKGMDLGYRLWPGPEGRPSCDLDVMVPVPRLAEARAALSEAGWAGVEKGVAGEAFLRDEGYNWHAYDTFGTLLELHFRLWGSVPAAFSESVWERSATAPELGSRARRPSWPDAFLICAVHLWNLPPPHAFLYFRELELIVRRAGEAVLPEVAESARRWGLSLQLHLAALHAARLWESPGLARLAESLRSDLRLPERLLARSAVARGVDAASLSQLYAARLLAGREARMGWKAPFRRLWPHPAVRSRRLAEVRHA